MIAIGHFKSFKIILVFSYIIMLHEYLYFHYLSFFMFIASLFNKLLLSFSEIFVFELIH